MEKKPENPNATQKSLKNEISSIKESQSADQLKSSAQRLFSQMNPESPDDAAYFQELITEFSAVINVMDQLKKFHAWCLDQHPLRIVNCRFRFRSWLANAAEYQKNRTQNQPPAFYSPKRRTTPPDSKSPYSLTD